MSVGKEPFSSGPEVASGIVTVAQPTVYYDSDQNRRPLITEFRNFWRYRGLIKLLVVRQLTVRYKRSVLGVWWTVLNPILTIAVLWVIFSNFFGRGGTLDEPYIVYLSAGILLSTYFVQGVNSTGASIINSRNILVKMYLPPEIFALVTALAAAANFILSLVPLFLLQLLTGVGIPWTVILVPLPLVTMLMFVTGIGLLIASAAVYFRDVLDITRVLTSLVNFLIPTFWTIGILEGKSALILVENNPVYSYLVSFRNLVYQGVIPERRFLIMMVVSSVVALMLGVYVFSRNWRRVVVRL